VVRGKEKIGRREREREGGREKNRERNEQTASREGIISGHI